MICKTDAGNGVMGCYYYYPFTNAQLKELERQAMIYKYMIASIPVPVDLLVSSSPPCNNKNAAGGDLEPGRCRRTDGKKWRCSKKSSLITNTVRDTCTEAVLVQESMWNFLILALAVATLVVPRKTEFLAL